jgi:hypothetical protein
MMLTNHNMPLEQIVEIVVEFSVVIEVLKVKRFLSFQVFDPIKKKKNLQGCGNT